MKKICPCCLNALYVRKKDLKNIEYYCRNKNCKLNNKVLFLEKVD